MMSQSSMQARSFCLISKGLPNELGINLQFPTYVCHVSWLAKEKSSNIQT